MLHRLAAADDSAACFATQPLEFLMAAWVSLIKPSIASHFSPEAFLPIDLKTACKVLIWPLVSPRWSLRAVLRSALLHGFDHFWQGFHDCVFRVIDVLKGMLEHVGEGFHRILRGRVLMRNIWVLA